MESGFEDPGSTRLREKQGCLAAEQERRVPTNMFCYGGIAFDYIYSAKMKDDF